MDAPEKGVVILCSGADFHDHFSDRRNDPSRMDDEKNNHSIGKGEI
jgi:hypothetical protein